MGFRQPRGLYFEDLEVGLEVVSPARTVTESDIVLFSGLTGDYNPLHTDAEYCRSEMYGERIAQGMLGLSYAVGLASRWGMLEKVVLAFLGLEWKFRAPIRIGDTIHIVLKVIKTRATSSGQGIVVFSVTELNQRGETVQAGQWTVMMKRRPADVPPFPS